MSTDCYEGTPFSQFNIQQFELVKWGRANRVPVSAQWELTPYCNLNCPMCYVHLTPAQAAARGKHLTAAQWLELGRQFADMGTMFLNLTGGEPLTRPDFWEIYEGVCRLGMYPTVLTNGCLIDERAMEHFAKFPPLGVKMSLYGASDETYERMCGVKHGFEKAAHAIELMEQAHISLMVTTTVVKENRDDVEAMRKFCDGRRMIFMATGGVVDSARGANTNAAASRLDDSPIPVDLETLEKMRAAKNNDSRLFSSCNSFGGLGIVTWHGHLQTCAFFEHEYVELNEPYNVSEAWKLLMQRMDAYRKPQACLDCPDAAFCRTCPGKTASATGYVDRIDTSVCARAAALHKAYREALAR